MGGLNLRRAAIVHKGSEGLDLRKPEHAPTGSIPNDPFERHSPARAKLPKLGSGKRFAAIERKAKASKARDPEAVAASAGIKKYGVKKMAKMAAAGRRRAK